MLNIDTSKILETEMGRKDFLKHVAVGAIAMSGVAAALKAMGYLPSASTMFGNTTKPASQNTAAYGTSVYGGTPVNR